MLLHLLTCTAPCALTVKLCTPDMVSLYSLQKGAPADCLLPGETCADSNVLRVYPLHLICQFVYGVGPTDGNMSSCWNGN